jgi:hypothetical protein
MVMVLTVMDSIGLNLYFGENKLWPAIEIFVDFEDTVVTTVLDGLVYVHCMTL